MTSPPKHLTQLLARLVLGLSLGLSLGVVLGLSLGTSTGTVTLAESCNDNEVYPDFLDQYGVGHVPLRRMSSPITIPYMFKEK